MFYKKNWRDQNMHQLLNWQKIETELMEKGFVKTDPLLSKETCDHLINDYDKNQYRSTITMQRYNFGNGEYKYFAFPLPDMITNLRQYFYQNLKPLANLWASKLKINSHYPQTHDDYINLCHDADQKRPTPLILKYGKGDYNCLHQDLYGDIHFPYQAAILLSDPTKDFTGGEFILVEQRPRMQSVPHVISLKQGEAIIFAVNEFPKAGQKGYYRAKLRHGVSKLHSGERYTLGIILHDGK
jgi:uncharacterized protein